MNGMSSLKTIKHLVKKGYLLVGCSAYKQLIMRLKEGTYGWEVLITNDESLG
jgi:hypothetical protein